MNLSLILFFLSLRVPASPGRGWLCGLGTGLCLESTYVPGALEVTSWVVESPVRKPEEGGALLRKACLFLPRSGGGWVKAVMPSSTHEHLVLLKLLLSVTLAQLSTLSLINFFFILFF